MSPSVPYGCSCAARTLQKPAKLGQGLGEGTTPLCGGAVLPSPFSARFVHRFCSASYAWGQAKSLGE